MPEPGKHSRRAPVGICASRASQDLPCAHGQVQTTLALPTGPAPGFQRASPPHETSPVGVNPGDLEGR